jgi:hypothetical protein
VQAGGRIWSLEGDKAYFSAWGNPHSWGANDYHQLPGGVRILGGEAVRDQLLLFTTAGLWVVSNIQLDLSDEFGNPQQRLEQVSSELVLWDPAGIADYENARVVPATDGVYLVDGVSAPVLISRSIEKVYRDYVRAGYRPGRATVYRSHYLLPILDSSGDVEDVLVCRLNRTVEAVIGVVFPWTRLDGFGGNVSAFAVRIGTTTRQPQLLGASRAAAGRVLKCGTFFEPAAAVKNDADGTTHQFDVVTRDFATGDPTRFGSHLVRRLRLRYELIDADADNPTIQAYFSKGTLQQGVSLWGSLTWGTGLWTDETGAEFRQMQGSAPEDDGRRPFAWGLQAQTRHIRYRLISSDPAASLVLRSLESLIRPSERL